MTIEQKIIDAINAGAVLINTANEYAPGKNYETNIGNYLEGWLDRVNPEDTEEAFEIRDKDGEATDEQEPIQHEILNLDFIVGVKKGSATSDYLRKAKADIYRMIGSNIDSWRLSVTPSLLITRIGWNKEITREKSLYGEITVNILIKYIQSEWLLDE